VLAQVAVLVALAVWAQPEVQQVAPELEVLVLAVAPPELLEVLEPAALAQVPARVQESVLARAAVVQARVQPLLSIR
jgi:hypothetical protein